MAEEPASACAAERVRTVQAAADDASPDDLACLVHFFPLRAQPGGVLTRRGHTEGTVDLMRLAGLKPAGVLCELTKPGGTMARLGEVGAFAGRHAMPVLTIEDIVALSAIGDGQGRLAMAFRR